MNKLMIMLVCAITMIGCGKKDPLDYTCITEVSSEITITAKGHIDGSLLSTTMSSSNGMESTAITIILSVEDKGDGATLYINDRGAAILHVGDSVSIGNLNSTSNYWLECTVD